MEVTRVCGCCEKGDPVVRRARKATDLCCGGGRVTEQRRALGGSAQKGVGRMWLRTANPDARTQSNVSDLTAKVLAEKGCPKGLLELPGGYYLEREPDVLVLRRTDGSLVAAFSSRGGAPEAGRWAAQGAGHGGAFAGRRKAPPASPTGPVLRANFFGRFELLRDGEIVPLGRNARALAILKYLLARRACPVPQDHLMDWLWPESDPKRARWSLNSAVYALRKLLGCCLPSLSAPETVLFEKGRYQLSPRISLSADTDEFDSRFAEGRRLEEAGRVPEAVAEYEKAVELYRGDYLVEDLYEDWTVIERERLIDAYRELLHRLAVYYMKTGQTRESVR